MAIVLDGSSAAGVLNLGTNGTITNLASGGLPDASVVKADLAADVAGTQGKILGLNSVTYDNTQRTINSTSWTDTGMEITYTPVASNSTALISLFTMARATGSQFLYLQLRQADAVWDGGSAGGDEYLTTAIGNTDHWGDVSATWHVSPTWTAGTATSFQIYYMKHTSSQGACYLGWGDTSTKGDFKDGLIIQEVAA